MKKILLATTALGLSAGVAAADITMTGSARMGIAYNSSAVAANQSKYFFTSRARVNFALSGETDGGLAFGAGFNVHDAGGANAGTAGSVFVSGAFGRLTMGDTNGAAEQVIGDVLTTNEFGLTGLGDTDETLYLGNLGGKRPTARYDNTIGGFTVALSFSNPGTNAAAQAIGALPAQPVGQVASIGVGYTFDGFRVGLGYETASKLAGNTKANHLVLGVGYSMDGLTVRANVGQVSGSRVAGLTGAQKRQYQIGASYVFDDTTVQAFYSKGFGFGAGSGPKSLGVGAMYDLGGGASIRGGIVRTDAPVAGGANTFGGAAGVKRTVADFGLNFTF